MLVGAIMLRRRVFASEPAVTRATDLMDEQAQRLPIVLANARAALAERHAGLEQQLWTIERLDKQMTTTTAALAARRHELDQLRERLEHSRAGVERAKSAFRMIMRAIELRRTILG